MMDLFWICVCLIICLLLFCKGALELEAVDGQFCTDAIDLSDAVTEGVERCLFHGFSAAEALVAAFRFGLLGSSAISMDDDGIPIGTTKSLVTSAGGFGGAVITVWFGLVGICTRRARVPGSFTTDVNLSVFTTKEPGANTSYSPSRLFLERFVLVLFFASLNSREASVRGTNSPTSG